MSVRRFRIDTHLDGASSVTVEIKPLPGKNDALVSVRPLHKRLAYTGLLSDVAQMVAARHAKKIAETNR